jgi:predicted RNA-binding protein with PUA-like domain
MLGFTNFSDHKGYKEHKVGKKRGYLDSDLVFFVVGIRSILSFRFPCEPVPVPSGKRLVLFDGPVLAESRTMKWLLKSEPDCYSYAQLVKDKKTVWDGITNALARKHLRTFQSGDEAFFYHTGDERAVVGILKVVSAPKPDPAGDDDKSVVVDVKPVKLLSQPVTLAQIKADPMLAKWDLVRLSRLSVVPVNDEQWARVLELAGEEV